MKKTFAIAHVDQPKRVSLWCDGSKESFYVINGAWHGSILENGDVIIKGVKKPMPLKGLIVWSGEIPVEYAHSYNGAIRWIESQL